MPFFIHQGTALSRHWAKGVLVLPTELQSQGQGDDQDHPRPHRSRKSLQLSDRETCVLSTKQVKTLKKVSTQDQTTKKVMGDILWEKAEEDSQQVLHHL